MTNSQLKFLIRAYVQTSKKLDKLKSDYENAVIYETVLKTIEGALKSEGALVPSGNQEQLKFLGYVNDTYVGSEIVALGDKAHSAKYNMEVYETKAQIFYLEKKLNTIKPMIGDEIVKKIKDYEIENVIKSEIL